MKTKFIIGFLFLFGILEKIQGQGWFLDSSYVWTELIISSQTGTHKFTLRYTFDSSPTMINGITYYEKLVSHTPSGNDWSSTNFFYRTDDSAKVYVSNFGNENLVYDYSLNVNASFYIPNGSGLYLVVDKIDSVQLENGEKRKQLALRCSFDEDPEHGWGYSNWIEGLGGERGVYDIHFDECYFDGIVPITLCISRNDTLLYDNPNYDSCWSATVATKDIPPDLISIFPNPASSEITIECKDHQIQNVSAIDLLGNTTFIGNISPFNISYLPPGYYFLRIELENKQLFMKQFIKQ